MSIMGEKWRRFADRVAKHIEEYVLPQYGDEGGGREPAEEYTAEDCIKQAKRYLARFGTQSRPGEEQLDLTKAAHWIQKAADRLEKKP